MTRKQFIKFREMIEREYSAAVAKHPKFADEFTACSIGQAMAGELMFKTVNSTAPYQADMLLQEEMWEATTAYIKGDKAHCLQELAQCGAVIFRMMEFVEGE